MNKCLGYFKLDSGKEIELACWESNGCGRTASSTIFLSDIKSDLLGRLTGKVNYTGFSATGNRLTKPHFEAEKKKYGKLVNLVGEEVLVDPDNIRVNIGDDGILSLYIKDEQEITLPEEYED